METESEAERLVDFARAVASGLRLVRRLIPAKGGYDSVKIATRLDLERRRLVQETDFIPAPPRGTIVSKESLTLWIEQSTQLLEDLVQRIIIGQPAKASITDDARKTFRLVAAQLGTMLASETFASQAN